MQLSIICPVYNEKNYVKKLAEAFLINDGIEKEVFFVDGGSDDGSREIIKDISQNDSRIKLVENEKKFVNFGFNKAFPLTNGRYIALLGAHAAYPKDFFVKGVEALESGVCDAVGGPLNQKGRTNIGKAIAGCLSSKFGVGDTEFRVYKERMYVDSVAFAIYNRKIFESIGLLDEDLIKNQDDEFHYRLNNSGYKMLMIPEMVSEYFVRDDLSGLIRQYFLYGLYKPLVLRKIKKVISIRHFIPALFFLYLVSLPLAMLSVLWIIPLVLYIILDVIYSFKTKGSFLIKVISLFVYPVIHISYGLGFIFGLSKD